MLNTRFIRYADFLVSIPVMVRSGSVMPSEKKNLLRKLRFPYVLILGLRLREITRLIIVSKS
jgi:hypothetical protein